MLTDNKNKLLLEKLIEKLELPNGAYEKAAERYQSLSKWFCRLESNCILHKPHIFPQGSFRLGTAIKPIIDKEEYDLDLACKLQRGINTNSHTQAELKHLVGAEVKSYKVAQNISAPVAEKPRCWRLEYADKLSFHIDIVPCFPANESQTHNILEALRRTKNITDETLGAGNLTVNITDNRLSNYSQISNEWFVSNPEGYALWFESRMKLSQHFLQEQAKRYKASKIDDLPAYQWKTPLQQTIQLLKRHRDCMFAKNPDAKAISIIITTLASRAYQGESDIESAVQSILENMGSYINSNVPKIPNPVNPNEDFSDKWHTPEGKKLKLEENFWNWLYQAQADFGSLTSSTDANFLAEQAQQKLALKVNSDVLRKHLGLGFSNISVVSSKTHIISSPPKPHRRRK